MEQKTKQFSQLWDYGIHAGIIAQIGPSVFSLLVVLAARIDKNGQCYPSREEIARKIGKSVRSVDGIIKLAKNTKYRGEPVIISKQIKANKNGKWKYGSNLYTISKPVREDLINRYQSASKNLPAGNNEELSVKHASPGAEIPRAEKLLTNDNPSSNEIVINEKTKSFTNKTQFRGITPNEFKENINNREQSICYEIASELGEEYMNFIISSLHDEQCGIEGIIWANGMTKEDIAKGIDRNKGSLFNFYIQKYKKDHSNN